MIDYPIYLLIVTFHMKIIVFFVCNQLLSLYFNLNLFDPLIYVIGFETIAIILKQVALQYSILHFIVM